MIKNECFRREWIDGKRSELAVTDPGLLEKCIHALQLLCLLADSEITFVFKGGTSMLLLLPRLRRLSIDIDIATDIPMAGYLPILTRSGSVSPFTRMEEDERGDDRLPRRRHFKFFYPSAYSQREDYVLLDVLEEGNVYPRTERRTIRTAFIETERDSLVTTPPTDALLADKLTAFAPATVGVPLNVNYSMQVVKQVVDVGTLFDSATDLPLIRSTYAALFTAENGYRGNRFAMNQALDDTIDTARMICESQLRGAAADTRRDLILAGMGRMASHLVGGPFRLDDLKIAAARAACVAALIRTPSSPLILADLRYDTSRVAALATVDVTHSRPLNRLKQTNPEALFCWHMVDTVLRGTAT